MSTSANIFEKPRERCRVPRRRSRGACGCFEASSGDAGAWILPPEIEARGGKWPTSAEAYLDWFERERDSPPLPADAPTVAVLLYRKHVITQQPYLADLVRAMEESGLRPVPIFINGVEAHTIVRDLLTTDHEREQRAMGHEEIDSLSPNAVCVDAVVSTVGFPLVGGPAGVWRRDGRQRWRRRFCRRRTCHTSSPRHS